MRKLAFSTVLVEGWALYCEESMHESGYYSDERVRLMQFNDLVWRACRVIVDASIHTGRLSFDGPVLKAFHDRLLSYGSIPPSIIAREMIRDLHREPARRD